MAVARSGGDGVADSSSGGEEWSNHAQSQRNDTAKEREREGKRKRKGRRENDAGVEGEWSPERVTPERVTPERE